MGEASAVHAPLFDRALLPPLHALQAMAPAEQAAFFTSALSRLDQDATSATKAAHAIFCKAALLDMDAERLEAALQSMGLAQACAAAASQCWDTHGATARRQLLLDSTEIHQLTDVQWKFGGTHSPWGTL